MEEEVTTSTTVDIERFKRKLGVTICKVKKKVQGKDFRIQRSLPYPLKALEYKKRHHTKLLNVRWENMSPVDPQRRKSDTNDLKERYENRDYPGKGS